MSEPHRPPDSGGAGSGRSVGAEGAPVTPASTGTATLAARILRVPIVRLLLAIAVVTAPVVIVQLVATAGRPGRPVATLPVAAIMVLVAYGAYRVYVRVVERRPAVELGSAGALPELARGLLLGTALFGATVGILGALGLYQVRGTNPLAVLAAPLAGSLVSGVFEEILFRGILFRIVEESLGTWLSLLISAVVFGLAHLANPGAGIAGAAAIIVEAGILLAAAYMLTRRLWLAIGLHVAWNFSEAGIFGLQVSGHPMRGWLEADLTGPVLLSGGAFGAEASVVAVALCLTVGVGFIALAARRGHIVPPYWRRATA